jgi:hypothetical protein
MITLKNNYLKNNIRTLIIRRKYSNKAVMGKYFQILTAERIIKNLFTYKENLLKKFLSSELEDFLKFGSSPSSLNNSFSLELTFLGISIFILTS